MYPWRFLKPNIVDGKVQPLLAYGLDLHVKSLAGISGYSILERGFDSTTLHRYTMRVKGSHISVDTYP